MLKPLLLLCSALLSQTCVASEPTAPVPKLFIEDMQRALKLGIATADTDKQVGVVMLKVTLDRQSAPIACETSKAPARYEMKLPADVVRSDFKTLARLVEAQCWKTIYPVTPDNLRQEDGSVDVLAPLYVLLPSAALATDRERRKANAQREFFWQHLLRDQPVRSIGRVSVNYQANAQGKVEGCLVQIHPHPLRPDGFDLDADLQAQLNSRCMRLDLSGMPGFAADAQGKVRGYTELEYAPWRAGRP